MKTKKISSFGSKTASLGAIVSLMGCSMCFPAIASLGAALGLGFLSQWEGLFINTLLPIFAVLALGINIYGWFQHKQLKRTILGVVGPTLLLLSIYPLFKYSWSTYVTYTGIGMMVIVSLWDIFSPATKTCEDGSCEIETT